MEICDLHTHVLPGVDDGAPSMDYALQMLQNAIASDVTVLAATPHCNAPFGNFLDNDLKQRFSQLQQKAEDLPIRLVLGGEVRVDEDFPQLLQEGKFPTINGSRYLLTEFAVNTHPDDFIPWLQAALQQDFVPVIAHPERYDAVINDPRIVYPWLDMGCHLQLTGGSIQGIYGKNPQQIANFLLQQDLVACIASDAHGLHNRSNFLLDVCDHLTVRYSKQYATCLMYETPLRICNNDTL